jgi:hypothetical protein
MLSSSDRPAPVYESLHRPRGTDDHDHLPRADDGDVGAEILDGVVGREPPEDGLDGVAGRRSVDGDLFACDPAGVGDDARLAFVDYSHGSDACASLLPFQPESSWKAKMERTYLAVLSSTRSAAEARR